MLLTENSSPGRFSSHESVFVLMLLMTLILAAATFFAPFALSALAAGLLLSVALHRVVRAHAGDGAGPRDPLSGINFAAIHVGGDEGGLIFVLGSIAILALGLPILRWFLMGSLIAALVVAVVRIGRRRPA
jgi:hypothetical protein